MHESHTNKGRHGYDSSTESTRILLLHMAHHKLVQEIKSTTGDRLMVPPARKKLKKENKAGKKPRMHKLIVFFPFSKFALFIFLIKIQHFAPSKFSHTYSLQKVSRHTFGGTDMEEGRLTTCSFPLMAVFRVEK